MQQVMIPHSLWCMYSFVPKEEPEPASNETNDVYEKERKLDLLRNDQIQMLSRSVI
jgi:hypothetical protein